MESSPTCFHCLTTIFAEALDSSASQRIGFRDTCRHCQSDLHVCRNCEFYDETSHRECRESSAEWVKNKEKSNVCEYFRLNHSAATSAHSQPHVMAALDALFKK